MKTVYILAKTLSSATQALHRNLEEAAFEEDFFAFRYIATAGQVRDLPQGQSFVVVQRWKDRPDAEEVLAALKERGWQSITLADLILS